MNHHAQPFAMRVFSAVTGAAIVCFLAYLLGDITEEIRL